MTRRSARGYDIDNKCCNAYTEAEMTEKEWRDALCKALEANGIEPKFAREIADGGEFVPDTTPEEAADDELYYMAQDHVPS